MRLRGLPLWRKRFSNRLNRMLSRKEMNVCELIRETGLPERYVWRLVRGETYPPYLVRRKIAIALGVEYVSLSRF